MYILHTERCGLRKMESRDAESFYRLNLHPDVYRFTTDPPFESVDAARRFLEGYSYPNGYGRWVVELKETGAFLGWCGIKFLEEENEYDVGYRFLPEEWNKGYATETAAAVIEYGFKVRNLSRIVARIHPENVKSIRVAAKLKMKYEKDIIYLGEPWHSYVIERSL